MPEKLTMRFISELIYNRCNKSEEKNIPDNISFGEQSIQQDDPSACYTQAADDFAKGLPRSFRFREQLKNFVETFYSDIPMSDEPCFNAARAIDEAMRKYIGPLL